MYEWITKVPIRIPLKYRIDKSSNTVKTLTIPIPSHNVEIFASWRPNVHEKKEGVVSVTAIVLKQPVREKLCVSMQKQMHLFGLPKVDVFRNH